MAVNIKRLPDEPIVIGTINGQMDVNSVRSLFALSAQTCDDIDGPIYRITDILDAQATIKDMARVVVEMARLRPGSGRGPRFKPVMVCGRNRLRFFTEILKQKEFGSIEMPVFDTVDDALDHVRAELHPAYA